MRNDPLIDLGMNGFDEIFMDSSELEQNRLPKIFQIPLTEIDDFPDHPFKVKLDEDMDQLVESIKERGVITPVTLRILLAGILHRPWYPESERTELFPDTEPEQCAGIHHGTRLSE